MQRPAIFCDMCCAMACNLNIQRYVLCVHRTLRSLLYRLVLCVPIHAITRRSKKSLGHWGKRLFLKQWAGLRPTGSSRHDRCRGIRCWNGRNSSVFHRYGLESPERLQPPRCNHQARLARASASQQRQSRMPQNGKNALALATTGNSRPR